MIAKEIMINTKVLSKEEIDKYKKTVNDAKKITDADKIKEHVNRLTLKFNDKLLKSNDYHDKFTMHYSFDMNDRDSFKKAIEIFDKRLETSQFKVDKIRYDTMYNSCPDFTIGYDIKIVPKNYAKGTWESIIDYWT